jgi:hypothetical protein
MERTSVADAARTLIRVAKHFDELGFYKQADTVLSLIKIAQSATQSLLGDVPGGFYLQNPNDTAYGLKNGIGGYPGRHGYWDANGREHAREVDLRSNMMGQEGMTGQDMINYQLGLAEQNQMYNGKEQYEQIARDIAYFQQQLQNPNITPEDKQRLETTILSYQQTYQALMSQFNKTR